MVSGYFVVVQDAVMSSLGYFLKIIHSNRKTFFVGIFSRPKTPNFFHRDADVAVEFMQELGHDRFSVVGWSDGAITGLVIAGK